MDLILTDISKAYGEKQVLDHISLTFPQGSRTCVMAPSGRGKTTFLRVILGLTKPDQGSVTGRPAKIAAVFQKDRLCGNLTVGGNLRMVCGNSKKAPELRALLTSLGIGETLDIPASQLSGGMARRVALARALLTDPELLILDEPFTGLDDAARQKSAVAIREFCPTATVLLVTHRKEDAALIGAARILEL